MHFESETIVDVRYLTILFNARILGYSVTCQELLMLCFLVLFYAMDLELVVSLLHKFEASKACLRTKQSD